MLPASLCAKIMVFRRITRIIEVVLNERAVIELQIFLTKMTQIRFICVPLQTESSWSVCRWYLYVQEESPGNTEHPTS